MADVTLRLIGVDEATGVIGGVGDALGGLGNLMQGALNVGIGAAVAGFTALAGGLAFSVGEAMEAEEGIARLNSVIESTGGKAGVTAGMALELADSLSGVTRFSDDAILAGENLLLTFTNIGADVFPQATEAMLNIAAAMGTDAKGAAVQLGKALNDPIAGMSALSRVGVSFTEEQKKAITAMVEAGDVAGAQAVILGELEVEFGGAAEAAGATFAGKLDILKNKLGNVGETIGTAILPMMTDFVDNVIMPAIPLVEEFAGAFAYLFESIALNDFDTAFDPLAEAMATLFGPAGAQFVYDVVDAFTGLYNFIIANMPAMQETATTVFTSIQQIVDTLWPVITEDLLPAFQNIFQAIFGDAPTAQEQMDGLLNAIQTGAQQAAAFVNDPLKPALEGFAAWSNENLVPLIEDIVLWLQTNIPIAIETASDFWTNTLLPAITGVWQWAVDNLEPLIVRLFDWLQATLPGAIQTTTDFFSNTLLPALTDIWEFINDPLIPLITELARVVAEVLRIAWEGLVQFYNEHIAPALEDLGEWINDTVNPAIEDFIGWINDATGGMEGISDALQDAIGWVRDLADALSGIHLPPNLTPGSPTPFERGLRGISSATRELRGDLRGLGGDMARMGGPSFGGGPVTSAGGFTGARPGGAGGGTLSGDPVVMELRKAVALLEKIVVELDGDNRVAAELSVALA